MLNGSVAYHQRKIAQDSAAPSNQLPEDGSSEDLTSRVDGADQSGNSAEQQGVESVEELMSPVTRLSLHHALEVHISLLDNCAGCARTHWRESLKSSRNMSWCHEGRFRVWGTCTYQWREQNRDDNYKRAHNHVVNQQARLPSHHEGCP